MVLHSRCILYGNVYTFIMLENPAFHLIDFQYFAHCKSRRNEAPTLFYHVICHFIIFPLFLKVISPKLWLFPLTFFFFFYIHRYTSILLYYFPGGKAAQTTYTKTVLLIYLTLLSYLMCSFLALKIFLFLRIIYTLEDVCNIHVHLKPKISS